MFGKRLLTTSSIRFFRKEDLFQEHKVKPKPLYPLPHVPEDVIPYVEYTVNGLTLEERRMRVENAPNPKDNQILSHLVICPDWNVIIPKGIKHLKTGVTLPGGIFHVLIQVIDSNLPYSHPLNYILHGYFPPLAYINPHVKFSMEKMPTIEKNQIIVKYKSGDEITVNAAVDSVDEILLALQTTFGIKGFNTPVPQP